MVDVSSHREIAEFEDGMVGSTYLIRDNKRSGGLSVSMSIGSHIVCCLRASLTSALGTGEVDFDTYEERSTCWLVCPGKNTFARWLDDLLQLRSSVLISSSRRVGKETM